MIRITRRVFGSAVLASAALLAVGATLAAHPAAARSLEEVQARGVISIFVYSDFPPHSFKENGQMVGADVDIARKIAETLKLPLDLVVREAGEKVDDDLRVNVWRGDVVENKAADLMLHVPYDRALEVRAEGRAVLMNPYFGESIGVAYNEAKLPEVKTFGIFATRPITTEVDTISDFFLSGAFAGRLRANVLRGRYFRNAEENFVSGKADAIMAPVSELQWMASRHPEMRIGISSPPMPGIVRKDWPIGMAVKEDGRDLGYEVQAMVDQWKADGTLKAIYATYGIEWTEPPLNNEVRDLRRFNPIPKAIPQPVQQNN